MIKQFLPLGLLRFFFSFFWVFPSLCLLTFQILNMDSAWAYDKIGLNLRKCVILPVTDNVNGVYSFPVYEELEKNIEQMKWCEFKSNAEILNILRSYERELYKHLDNKNILQLIAEKLEVGSLIRIHMEEANSILTVYFKVYGAGGDDVYFEKSLGFNKNDTEVINLSIQNWLKEYSSTLPYDGLVTGITGVEFTTDIGYDSGREIGKDQLVRVVRPRNVKKHPLLNKIVDWDVIKLADARVLKVGNKQSLAQLKKSYSRIPFKVGDWVRIEKEDLTAAELAAREAHQDEERYREKDSSKLGVVGINARLGKGSLRTEVGNLEKKMGGILYGLSANGELWIMRNWWTSLKLSQNVGSFKKEEGNLQKNEATYTHTEMKLKFGYRYLPLGFFYGPQIDFSFGLAKDMYGIDQSASDGFADSSFTGPLIGVAGNIPIKNFIRLMMYLDFYFASSFSSDSPVLHSKDSASSYEFGFGGQLMRPNDLSYTMMLVFKGQKASFSQNISELQVRESYLQFGISYQY